MKDVSELSTNEKVKTEMALKGHTKTKLAELLGISRWTLQRKLNNIYPWTVAELKELEKIYEKERAYFF